MQTSLDVRNPTASDPRWAAVVARDRRADGRFVYAVRTTGVYCRPSCGSRRPRFENVVFHDNADAAERAGFRPCRRCRPERRDDDPHVALIARLCRAIDAGDAPPLAGMAREAGLSGTQLRRLFRAATGLTPKAYVLAARARRLRDALPLAPSVTDAIQDAGFASSGHFHAQAAPMIGMSAQRFRRAGAGMQIRYSVDECSLGSILVAMTDRGVCAILIGDEPAPLLRDLQQRFANATLQGGDADFDATMASAIALVDEPGRGFDLPLDVRGTAFQHRVWQVLREIPAGETMSYADLARRVGVPAAVRAVAQACAANPVAVAIPCHRVVRSDGTLSGYRWGVERKRALLAREAAKRDER